MQSQSRSCTPGLPWDAGPYADDGLLAYRSQRALIEAPTINPLAVLGPEPGGFVLEEASAEDNSDDGHMGNCFHRSVARHESDGANANDHEYRLMPAPESADTSGNQVTPLWSVNSPLLPGHSASHTQETGFLGVTNLSSSASFIPIHSWSPGQPGPSPCHSNQSAPQGGSSSPEQSSNPSPSSTSTCRRHRSSRRFDETIFCPYDNCPELFKRPCDFRKHMKRHTRPYKCTCCPKAFYQDRDLQKHSRTHLGGPSWRCPWEGCSSKYTVDDNLVRHIRKKHGVVVPKGSLQPG